ncbi:MAG: hypothetical protein M1830_008986 [Pleopsidium flavum]|nr:MAG: hypothetical protein M1830_008986 [Pleopsidium flavum]
MAARFKKIFSRKKDKPQQRDEESHATGNDLTIRTSLYESATPAGPPKTGAYPIKGNANTPPLAGRRNSTHNHKNHSDTSNMPPPPIPQSQLGGPRPISSNAGGGVRMVQDDAAFTNDLSNLSLNDRNAARGSGQPQVPSHASRTTGAARYSEDVANRSSGSISAADMQNPQYSYMSAVYGENVADRNIVDGNRGNRSTGGYGAGPSNDYIAKRDRALSHGRDQESMHNVDGYRGTRSPYPSAVNDSPAEREFQDGFTPMRRRSIPRKQVGSGISTPVSPPSQNYPSPSTSSPNHMRQSSVRDKPLPSTPPGTTGIAHNFSHGGDWPDPPTQQDFGGKRMLVEGATERPSLEGILDLSNTKDTMVIEKIAPAVVHETVNKQIHHVREEVITREIHTHDVFHRIQPIIDVEVLPPRHFLPVEGGGLVEVSADEVPGRHNNWVIAETASKIPSDEPAPAKTTRFSARQFRGAEGDAKQYVTPEGIKQTEETWVHPPELEDGGRITGQTWPMYFPASEETVASGSRRANLLKSPGTLAQPMGRLAGERQAKVIGNFRPTAA